FHLLRNRGTTVRHDGVLPGAVDPGAGEGCPNIGTGVVAAVRTRRGRGCVLALHLSVRPRRAGGVVFVGAARPAARAPAREPPDRAGVHPMAAVRAVKRAGDRGAY